MESDSEYHGLPLLGVNSSWPIMTLENICDGIFDCPHSTPKLSDDGYYMVRTQDIRKGFFDTQNAVKISKQSYIQRIKRAKPQYGDLLFSREGTYFGDAAEVPQKIELCLGQRMVLLRPCPEIINPTFLRIWINSKSFQIHLRSFRDGTVAERLNMSTIRKLPVPVPSLKIQSQVISLIIPLEKKDALNRQMNATLEGMAQALFKSWFVDFDPVIDNALAAGNPIPEAFAARTETRRKALADGTANREVAKQFPAAFQFNDELGNIPDGWEIGKISDLFELHRGFDLSAKNRKIGTIPVYSAGGIHGNHNAYKVKAPGIITGRSGVIGNVFLSLTTFWPLNTTLYVRKFRKADPYYTLHFLKNIDLKIYNSGSAVPSLNRNFVHSTPTLIPSEKILRIYEGQADHIFKKIKTNGIENENLSNLRDTLLPKLISGEIRIPEAEKLTEEALA